MSRPVTLFTGQWADLTCETICRKAKSFGYDGLELACWGDHFDVNRALGEDKYCAEKRSMLTQYDLSCFSISNHLVGQAVCDVIDSRHQAILPSHVWGDGDPVGVRLRAVEEMKATARAARRFGVEVVNGFVGSGIWHLLYSFPPVDSAQLDAGYEEFGCLWKPILDVFQEEGVRFALEVHPTEIAFDTVTASRAIEALEAHPAFGFNYDPSHLGYQGVDYVAFLREFRDRIFHVHMKDVAWSDEPRRSGVFGGHLNFGDPERYWDFRSVGRGNIDFESIVRTLNDIGYKGPLSVEWEDSGMDRDHGAAEAADFVRSIDFPSADRAFDASFGLDD